MKYFTDEEKKEISLHKNLFSSQTPSSVKENIEALNWMDQITITHQHIVDYMLMSSVSK